MLMAWIYGIPGVSTKNMEQQATSVDVTSEVIEFFLRRKSITGDHVVELREVKHPGAYYPRMMRENILKIILIKIDY